MRLLATWAASSGTWLHVAWAAIVAITASPLIGPVIYGSDVNLHFFRLPVVQSMWAAGIAYTGWQPTLGHGYGYPLFGFYPPLSSYMYALIAQLTGLGAPGAFNAAFALAIVIAVVSMGQACRRLFGALGAVIGPAAYVWSPAFLAQVYDRTSLPNTWSLAFFALALWVGVLARTQGERRGVIVAAAALGGMVLSHLASGLLLSVVWVLLMWAWTRRPWPALALTLGLAISAFSWVPSVVEISATQYRGAVAEYLTAQGEFAFSPLWRWPETVIAGVVNSGIPARGGEVHLLLGLAAIGGGPLRWHQGDRHVRALGRMALVIGAAGLLIASPHSAWLWHHVDGLAQTQIPARWLDASTPALALIAAWTVQSLQATWARHSARFKPADWRRASLPAGVGALTLAGMLVVALTQLYPPRYTAPLPDRPTLAHARQIEERYGITGLTSWGEYWPMRFEPSSGAAPAVDALDPAARLVPNAQARTVVLSKGYNSARLRVNAKTTTLLTFDIPKSPGWTAEVDGQAAPVGADSRGRLRVLVLAGESTVTLAFTGSAIQQATMWLSLITAMAMAVVLVGAAAPRRSQRSPQHTMDGRSPAMVTLWLLALVALKWAVLDRVATPLVTPATTGLVRPLPDRTEPIAIGSRLEIAGAELGPHDLILYWRVRAELDRNYLLRLKLQDALGREIAQSVVAPTGAAMTSQWMPGQIVRLVVPLPVFEAHTPYAYTLAVEVRDPHTRDLVKPGAVAVATLRAAPGKPKRGPLDAPVQAVFADAVRLDTARLPDVVRCGLPFVYQLRWVAVAPIAEDWTTFVHVLDQTGAYVAGQDLQPLDGRFATSAWAPGDVVVADHAWQLNLPAGRYQVQAGLYNADTGQRLALSDGGTSINLGEITVVCAPGATS